MTRRFLLVELEDELPPYREVGIYCALKQVPGVRMVCDLEAISQTTLESFLLGPTETVVVCEPIKQLEFMT